MVTELGDITTPIYARSTLKPLQALASMQAGVPLRGAQAAIACGSHVGSLDHMDVVEGMLKAAGAKGIVTRFLRNDTNDVDGVLLKSGEQIRFPTPTGGQLMALHKDHPRGILEVSGLSRKTRYGTVIEARDLKFNGQALASLDAPPPPAPSSP